MNSRSGLAGRVAIALLAAIAALAGMLYLARSPQPAAPPAAVVTPEKPPPTGAEKRLLDKAVRDERQRQGEESVEGRTRMLAPLQAK